MPHQPLNEKEWALWRAVTLMSRQLNQSIDQRLQADAGISRADFEILRALATSPNHQARARDLGDMLAWEKSRLSHQVTRMVTRGLVVREDSPATAPGRWIALAPAGQVALDRALPGYEDQIRADLLDVLDPAQATSLLDAALSVIHASDLGACRVELDSIELLVKASDPKHGP